MPLPRKLFAACVLALAPDALGQQAYLKASNADTNDLFGFPVAISGDTLVVGAFQEDSNALGVDGDQGDDSAADSGAAYVFVRSGTGWTQQAYLKASNTEAGDNFGWSVAVSGDTVVVGAPLEDGGATGVNGDEADNGIFWSGAAYVFVRNGASWSQQAYLKASNTGPSDSFGWSVALSGDTLTVGAIREDSSATGVNGDESDDGASGSGAAYVFTRSGTSWSQQAYLKASNTDASDTFGVAVAVSGDTIVVGADGEDSGATGVDGDQADNGASQSGAAYVFERSGTSWSQQAYLKASNTDGGGTFGDTFGRSVAVSADTVVVGAPNEDSNATGVNGDQSDNSAGNSGAAYVYTRSGASWSQQTYLKASNTDAFDIFGVSVAVSGDALVVGATGEASSATGVNGDQTDNSALSAGAAYLFLRSGTSWSQQAYLKASDDQSNVDDRFGTVAVSGDTVLVGAFSEDNLANNSGAAFVFAVPASECFLVIGDAPGDAPFHEIEHLFQTQVGPTIEDSYAVLMTSIPEFVLPTPQATVGLGGTATQRAKPANTNTPAWMLDGHFAVQVLMWNPAVFPGLPEQCTQGLYVTVHPDGSVLTEPFGTPVGGMTLSHELDTNATGQKVIRFPFSIPGL